ncbi:MAG: lysophospholipid acyltransferase family protein [Eubacteriales bacterium]
MIRYLCVVFTVVSFLILFIPALLFEWFIGKVNPSFKDRSSLILIQLMFRVCLWFSGAKVTTIGLENVPKDQAVLYIANHRSVFDILLTCVRFKGPTGFISKLEMNKWPLLNLWMRNIHCLFLDRKDLRQGLKVILESIEKVKSGISICVFPEGTRSKKPDQFLPFHEGSFRIATKTNCPIIPIAINNAHAIFEDQFPKIRPVTVILEYGTPIHLEELSDENKKYIGAYTQKIIEEMYHKNKALI